MGLALVDVNQMEIDPKSFSYINFALNYVKIILNSKKTELENCQLSSFINENDFNVYSERYLQAIAQKTIYYLCPKNDTAYLLSP